MRESVFSAFWAWQLFVSGIRTQPLLPFLCFSSRMNGSISRHYTTLFCTISKKNCYCSWPPKFETLYVRVVERVVLSCRKQVVLTKIGENADIAFYPQKQGILLLQPRKSTKMTKMAGVTPAKWPFAKSTDLTTLIMEGYIWGHFAKVFFLVSQKGLWQMGLPTFQTFSFFFQWYKLELEDVNTDTEHCKWPSLSLHGPASASITFLTWSRMLKPRLKRPARHHSFQVNVCQPRLSAKVVLPRVLQQEECLCNFWKPHRNFWLGKGHSGQKTRKTIKN